MAFFVWILVSVAFPFPFISQCSGSTDKHRHERLLLDQDLASALVGLQKEMESLKQQVNELSGHPNAGQGSTYTRWGRSVCPGNGTDRVYYGFAAGNHYTKTGGPADFLCLTSEPTWAIYDDADQPHSVNIYGAEYETGEDFSDGGAKFFGQNLQNHDVPCAVCHTSGYTTLMIPGRNTCYPGWKLEYHGYLMSGYAESAATNYVCLDAQAETQFGDINTDNGKLMEFVEVTCGSLKCPPYVQNRELTCVVCSK